MRRGQLLDDFPPCHDVPLFIPVRHRDVFRHEPSGHIAGTLGRRWVAPSAAYWGWRKVRDRCLGLQLWGRRWDQGSWRLRR
eukprot:9900349-Prorocentrum_lima.AAC.1